MNPAVDRFVAHPLRIVLKRKPAGDLLGGEVPYFQEVFETHFKLQVVDEARLFLGSLSAPEHAGVRVAFVIQFAFFCIALELAPYAGATFIQHTSNLNTRRFAVVHAAQNFALRKSKVRKMPTGRCHASYVGLSTAITSVCFSLVRWPEMIASGRI